MIIADTSVWIDYLQGKDLLHAELLDDALLAGKLAIGDLILVEILQGIKSDKQFKVVKEQLSLLDQFSMLTPASASQCAQNYRLLRKKGITVRKTNDVIIASFCIQHNMTLLHADKDYEPFRQHLGLKTLIH